MVFLWVKRLAAMLGNVDWEFPCPCVDVCRYVKEVVDNTSMYIYLTIMFLHFSSLGCFLLLRCCGEAR